MSELFSNGRNLNITHPSAACSERHQWRIQDFSEGASTPEEEVRTYYQTNFSEKYMKMNTFWPGGSATAHQIPASHWKPGDWSNERSDACDGCDSCAINRPLSRD